jgi:hypothetical protein
MAARVRARGDACWLTLGAGDVLGARGVRLAAVAPSVDVLGVACSSAQLASALGETNASPWQAIFVAQLAQRLAAPAGDAADRLLAMVVGIPSGDEDAPPEHDGEPAARWDVELLDPVAAAAYSGELVDRLWECGTAAVVAGAWSDTGERTLQAPPCDHAPSLARWGLADTASGLKPAGDAWSAMAHRELARSPADPWPASLDVEAYYANLPDSLRDLAVQWRHEREPDGAPR